MKNKLIPRGLRDILPEQVKVRREMEKKLSNLFLSYGFNEVITPTFEFLEVIETGAGSLREELFLFMDREGGILSLRPEVTVAIARLVASHYKNADFPQRLFYLANVFRHVQPQRAQHREFWQMGIELIGASGVRADAEVITIAVEAMRAIGVPNFKISLNQIAIFNSLLEASGLGLDEQERIRGLVENKDLVELHKFLASLAIDDKLKETINKLPVLHGGLDLLEEIPYIESNRGASLAVEELIKVYEALEASKVKDDVVLDMGVIRGLDYYTGIVFEGYAADLGYGLLGGGRYDNLIGQFGYNAPATGFAMGLDRLALVLDAKKDEPPHYLIGGQDYLQLISKCQELRGQGHIVEMDVRGLSRSELAELLVGKPNFELIYID